MNRLKKFGKKLKIKANQRGVNGEEDAAEEIIIDSGEVVSGTLEQPFIVNSEVETPVDIPFEGDGEENAKGKKKKKKKKKIRSLADGDGGDEDADGGTLASERTPRKKKKEKEKGRWRG